MSIRVSESELKQINKLAKTAGLDKSAAARELLRDGWFFYWIRQYREEKVSLENLSTNLNLSLSETIDLLAELGIEAPVSYDDYISGYKFLDKTTNY